MKMRWLAAGITAVLITGGAATVAQRVITQKTRGVLPATNDPAHPDTPRAVESVAFKVEASRPRDGIAAPAHEVQAPVLAATAVMPTPAVATTPPPLPAEAALVVPEDPAVPAITPTVSVQPAVNPPDDPAPAPTPAADPQIAPANVPPEVRSAALEPAAAQVDPVEAVETFVERNRKEAEGAIHSLAEEAENLKNRLAKVESALGRWQSFARALNNDHPPSQTDVPAPAKPNWKRPDAEIVEQPTRSTSALEPGKPAPSLPAEAPRAEIPANPPVASPAEAPASPPAEPPPADLPSENPPPAPPHPPS